VQRIFSCLIAFRDVIALHYEPKKANICLAELNEHLIISNHSKQISTRNGTHSLVMATDVCLERPHLNVIQPNWLLIKLGGGFGLIAAPTFPTRRFKRSFDFPLRLNEF
jgi:hypothetical protein